MMYDFFFPRDSLSSLFSMFTLLQDLRDVHLQQEKTIATLQPHLLKLTELQCRLHSEQSGATAELDEARREVAGVDESIAKLEALRAELTRQHKAYIQKGIDEVRPKRKEFASLYIYVAAPQQYTPWPLCPYHSIIYCHEHFKH